MSEPTYREVKHISQLSRGDHIAWQRKGGFCDHAIIEWVLQDQGSISVIEKNNKYRAEPIMINNPFLASRGPLFIREHQNSLPAEEVVGNAYNSLGEIDLTDGEQYATKCKEELNLTVDLSRQLSDLATGLTSSLSMDPNHWEKILARLEDGPFDLAEIISCIWDVLDLRGKLERGVINGKTFLKAVVARIANGVQAAALRFSECLELRKISAYLFKLLSMIEEKIYSTWRRIIMGICVVIGGVGGMIVGGPVGGIVGRLVGGAIGGAIGGGLRYLYVKFG